MSRYWMCWWGGHTGTVRPTTTEGAPPWSCAGHKWDEKAFAIVAVVDAPSEVEAWAFITKLWPGAEPRFCHQKARSWDPGDRFHTITEQLRQLSNQ